MVNEVKRVAIITNVIANYREDFYRRILADQSMAITVFCQDAITGMNLKTVHEKFAKNVKLIKSIGLAKEKIAWQFLPFLDLYKNHDILFFYGNPRVLSNVIYSVLFKMLGKKVIIWGQAHTAGANPIMEKIRLAWWRFFDYLFLYTDKEIEYLQNKGFKAQKMLGMNNGLNQDEIDHAKAQWPAERLAEWKKQQGIEKNTLLLSCARLEPKNQFELMIPALAKLCETNPKILWCVIGQGQQEAALRNAVNQAGLDDHVLWLGAIYDENELAPWFISSTLLIHPGAIGLRLLHAFGYALPVITHNDMANQMPEMAAFEDDINGVLFVNKDASSLFQTIHQQLSDEYKRQQLSQAAYQTAKKRFNTTIMAHRFLDMAMLTDANSAYPNQGA